MCVKEEGGQRSRSPDYIQEEACVRLNSTCTCCSLHWKIDAATAGQGQGRGQGQGQGGEREGPTDKFPVSMRLNPMVHHKLNMERCRA